MWFRSGSLGVAVSSLSVAAVVKITNILHSHVIKSVFNELVNLKRLVVSFKTDC
jgi:hypothetical protein